MRRIIGSIFLLFAVLPFVLCWLGPVWPFSGLLGDPAFDYLIFTKYRASMDVKLKLIVPHRHTKNVLKFNHGVTKCVYLQLKNISTFVSQLCALKVV